MNILVSKGVAKAHITFEYSTKFNTLIATFRHQHFYLNSKNPITRIEAKALIRKLLIQLKDKNVKIVGAKVNSLPRRNINYTLVSPTGTFIESIINYLTLTNLRIEVFR